MGLTIAMTFGLGVVVALLHSEIEAWLPWVAERLRRIAVRSLPPRSRARLSEEWAAFLQEVPGGIGKVFSGLGFIVASGHIAMGACRRSLASAGTDAVSSVVCALAELAINFVEFLEGRKLLERRGRLFRQLDSIAFGLTIFGLTLIASTNRSDEERVTVRPKVVRRLLHELERRGLIRGTTR